MSPRRLFALRGEPARTAAEAARLCASLEDVLDVGLDVGEGGVPPGRTRRLLGQAFDAVVIDAHEGLDADLLGRCHGLVRGGGALLLRLPPAGEARRWGPLTLPPFAPDAVGTRFWERLERALEAADAPAPLAPPARETRGTAEQGRVVATLAEAFRAREPAVLALIADRGRGKSAALGLALAEVSGRVAVTAPSEEAAREVLRFAPEGVAFVPPEQLLGASEVWDVIVVDEAAQLPVPFLRELVERSPAARIAFATTTHGYEGTGRGFALRFLRWLEAQARPFQLLSLEEPIRWAADDPLEAWVFRLLALDSELAEPAEVSSVDVSAPAPRLLDRDALACDERLLRSLFALLVHAHYRTTPNDLLRLLDAPNQAVHAIVREGEVLAATLVAREGGLAPETCAELAEGRWRIRGHALADTLVVHSARPAAGELSIVRSVRIATHPALRRRGLARALVEHVHASYRPDLFGTLFGATPDLLAFRRALGYQAARVGLSRGVRSGAPPVVMLRPGSERGAALLGELRADLARDLPLQLAWLEADSVLGLDPELGPALGAGLEPARALNEAEVEARFARCARGPQPLEAAGYVVERWLRTHPAEVAALDARAKALLEGRVLERRNWHDLAAKLGGDVPRALADVRRALQALAATLSS